MKRWPCFMTKTLTILMAQINPIVGAIESNTDKIIQIITDHQHTHDLIIFPEFALCGYPPEDLLLRQDLFIRIDKALQMIVNATFHCHIVLGHPQIVNGQCYNTASILYQTKIKKQYFKQQLPNYGVFDEKRYFTPGNKTCILKIHGYRIGLCICQDLWQGPTVQNLVNLQIDILVILNASPFETTKRQQREALIRQKAKGIITIYVNLVGGQDELVFDGQSMAINAQGEILARAAAFTESLHRVQIHEHQIASDITPLLDKNAEIYQALLLGLRDYVHKNNIPGVLLGLSGGIDSALTLAIAVDALGPDKVMAVLLPSRYTSAMSIEDAEAQIQTMQIQSKQISIESGFQLLSADIAAAFTQPLFGITLEN
ncbi:MAG TPA: nitrilase-related carbon-nitrogen hydrolase, partial [Legionellaceae bacterium]|nr:nitrilase-related carbon-nitrogen hydrolase [Legionellaceae bacterium]